MSIGMAMADIMPLSIPPGKRAAKNTSNFIFPHFSGYLTSQLKYNLQRPTGIKRIDVLEYELFAWEKPILFYYSERIFNNS